ncbi:aminoglycoside phosphotransferase family protein [Neobacillus drentensis]|uniref:phosphotransferase family protein n=1 Tax=Neobacillus drentensis TaxID=220684 RepID=UPI003000F7E1
MAYNIQNEIEKIIGEIHSFDLLEEQGCTSEVRRLVTINGCYLLKSAYNERYRTWLKAEAQVLERLTHEREIPVPAYYGYIEKMDSSHLIMSFEEGITLTAALESGLSNSDKKALVKSFGQFLHHFHEMRPIEALQRENDWLEEQFLKAQNYIENGQTEGSLELLNKLKSQKPLPVQQTIIHGDCTTDNVLVIDGKVELFIDVSGMTVGDPRYDESLAISPFVDNPEYLHAFYEGYTRYKVSKEEFLYFNEGLYEFF